MGTWGTHRGFGEGGFTHVDKFLPAVQRQENPEFSGWGDTRIDGSFRVRLIPIRPPTYRVRGG
ncbi:MAG: hypothetical protein STSR0009_03360 [Methanoregula sp.]